MIYTIYIVIPEVLLSSCLQLYVPHKPHVDVDPEIEALKKEIYAEYHK